MKIIPFEERYRQDFIDFNSDWIVSNFGFLEQHDQETFEQIDAAPMEGTTWEICKPGSNKRLPHKGAGSAVFKACMDRATEHARSVYSSFPTAI